MGSFIGCDSFENNRNARDIKGSKNVTMTQKMKFTAIMIVPSIIVLCFSLFSDILSNYMMNRTVH